MIPDFMKDVLLAGKVGGDSSSEDVASVLKSVDIPQVAKENLTVITELHQLLK